MKSLITKLIGVLLAGALGTYVLAPDLLHKAKGPVQAVTAGEAAVKPSGPIIPAVTVIKAATNPIIETVIVSGTLVPREEILVAAEVDGLSIFEVKAEEGDWVEKGQLLARLNKATLEAQVAQNDAQIARAEAAIAQAESADCRIQGNRRLIREGAFAGQEAREIRLRLGGHPRPGGIGQRCGGGAGRDRQEARRSRASRQGCRRSAAP